MAVKEASIKITLASSFVDIGDSGEVITFDALNLAELLESFEYENDLQKQY